MAAMHSNEIHVDLPLVRRLIAEQFPEWSDLHLRPVESAGTDNTLYRLGEDMVVRLPRRAEAAEQIGKERRWLPVLAPGLSLGVPLPLAIGRPDAGYPHEWSICRWLPGRNALDEPIADLEAAAVTLAQFIAALRSLDTTQAPVPGTHNFHRGVPLRQRDKACREAICRLGGEIDTDAALRVWTASLEAPAAEGKPVWLHGDLHAGNLLLEKGAITGIIDFGGLAAGDGACDLMVAWNLLDAESRRHFRAALAVDDAAWMRGRGWALSMAVIALPYYLDSNPVIVRASHYTIGQVLSEA